MFKKKCDEIMQRYETVVTRKNEKTEFYNGIYDRYKYPVLTRDHIPPFWKFDMNPETNPYFMERLGVNAVFNSGAIELDGKFYLVARVDNDLLSHGIDFTTVEFSVNDDNTDHFMETYEGLVRHIYGSENNPAMLIVNNIRYDNGKNAQEKHNAIGTAYKIPCVSMKMPIYSQVQNGNIDNAMILNGNFEETWGDSLHIDTVVEHLPYGKHSVEIEIIETQEDDKVPFYLVSVIGLC